MGLTDECSVAPGPQLEQKEHVHRQMGEMGLENRSRHGCPSFGGYVLEDTDTREAGYIWG